MTTRELEEAVRDYKNWINCDSTFEENYPEELVATEESILHWCLGECLDTSEYGLYCPQESCPLYNSFKSLVFNPKCL